MKSPLKMLAHNRHVIFGQAHQINLLKMPKGPNLPCHKIGQVQPRVIIYLHDTGLTPKMLHTKFQGNRPSGSGEDF